MKQFALYLLITFVILFSFTGCNLNPESNNPSITEVTNPKDEQIDILVVTSYGGDDGNRQNYENAVKIYENTTGNTVYDDSGISNEQWKAKIAADFENGNEPDVLFYFTGADSDKIIRENKVVPLEEIIEEYPEYASNMRENMLPKSAVDNKSYAIPVNGFWEGLYVNKKVLADCGVEIPNENTTWEEFMADCRKIADKGYTPIDASLKEVPHYWFEYCIYNNGSPETHLKTPASDGNIEKIWESGLNDIKTLYENGFFPKDTLSITSTQADKLIIENKAAFMIEGSWKMGWFAENASDINDFTVTFVPGKNERKTTDIIGGLSMGYFITRKAWDNPEKRKACIEFVTVMTSDEIVATFGVTAITALKNNLNLPSDSNSLVKDAYDITNNYTNIVASTADGLTPDLRTEIFTQISDIVTGNITADNVINRCFMLTN